MATYKEDVDVVQLDEVAVSASRGSGGRNYGGDGSGGAYDRFMYGLDQVNQYLPMARHGVLARKLAVR